MISKLERNLLIFSDKFINQKTYWLSKLEKQEEPTMLAAVPYAGGSIVDTQEHEFSFPETLSTQITQLGNQSSLSIYIILLTALKVLLRKYNGNDLSTVLSPVNRTVKLSGLNDMVFIQDRITQEDSFKSLLVNVSRSVTGAYKNQDYPSDGLLELLELDQEEEHYTHVICLLTDIHGTGIVRKWPADVLFSFSRKDAGLKCTIHYDQAIHEPFFIHAVAAHYLQLLNTALADLDQLLSAITVFPGLADSPWVSGPSVPLPAGTVVDLFQQQVKRTPDNSAVVCRNVSMSYRQLNEQVNRLAFYLRTVCQLEKGRVVAVMMDRSVDLISCIMAIWKCGAVFMPLDVHNPGKRRDMQLENADPQLIIAAGVYTAGDKRWLIWNDLLQLSATQAAVDPGWEVLPGELAYIIYTSGSTGVPKGVMIEHQGMLNHLMAKISTLHIGSGSVLAQTASITFDIAVWQCFGALLCGGKTIVYPGDQLLDVQVLLTSLQRDKVTIAEVVPSYLALMAECTIELPDLQYMLATGEVLPAATAGKWKERFPGAQLINAYGPTEASDDITQYNVTASPDGKRVPVGRPLQNLNVYVLNRELGLCPKGLRGEIYVSGTGVGRGYLFDDAMTSAAFLPDPFFPGRGVRMYRTGDTGYYNEEGILQFTGRNNEQLKIKGYRIEMGEIIHALTDLPDIVDAVVKVWQDGEEEKYLCAYYISRGAEHLAGDVLRTGLSERLPAHMIPAYFIKMASFPVNASGKVNKKVLPHPKAQPDIAGEDRTAGSAVEEQLMQMVKKLLSLPAITRDEHFFKAGGHSLSVARLILMISKTFGVKLAFRDVFDNPVLSSLANVITQAAPQQEQQIQPLPAQELYEVSQSQKRLWIISQMEEDKFIYNIPQSYLFEGPLNVPFFSMAIDELVARHESLRTIFVNIEGVPWQRVKEVSAFRGLLLYRDLSEEIRQEEIIREMVQAEERYPFDLYTGPLIRVVLLKRAHNEYVLLFTLHHIIADGWSMEVIKKDLFALYNSYLNGTPSGLRSLAIHYKDYAAWQKQQVSSAVYATHRQYWLDMYKGDIPVLELPVDFPRPPEKTYNGREITFQFGEQLGGQVLTFCQQRDVSLFMFLMATVKTLLYKYSGQTDIVVGMPIAGRSHLELEDQIGFYVNLLPVRSAFTETMPFDTLLEHIKITALQAYEHQSYPFDHLIEELGLEREMSRSPLFDVLLTLQNTEMPGSRDIAFRDIQISDYPLERTVVKYDLSFNVTQDEKDVIFSLEYNNDLFGEQRMEQLVTHFINIVRLVIAQPQTPLLELDYLSPEEKQALLLDLNDTQIPYASHLTVIDLFRNRLAAVPDAAAVVTKERVYTYAELEAATNRLAACLVTDAGVKPGDVVAMALPRSADCVVCMLGIMKAGGCFAAIDFSLPEARISYIINDLQPKAIVTDQAWAADAGFPLIYLSAVMAAAADVTAPVVDLEGKSPSYIVYTSGSTGYPKGVVQTHQTLYNLISWQMENWGHAAAYRFLQFSSFGFDAAMHEIYFALATGGSVYILDDDERNNFERIRNIILHMEIDVIWFSFSALAALFNEMEDSFMELGLKHIVTTGEQALLNNKLGSFLRKRPDVILHNFYGPSETHVVTSFSLTGNSLPTAFEVSIGKPVYNTRIFILNPKMMLQPAGVPGEIYIETDHLFAGYLHLPELTDLVRIANPFNPDKLLYKTGDFGAWNFDGNIDFLGRKDDQIKIRGYRIELKEIEYHLTNYNGISGGVVSFRTNRSGEKELVAYIVKESTVSVSELTAFLFTVLPEYMVPVHFIVLDTIPLNNNGKADRHALPDPEDYVKQQECILPANETEEKLYLIWRELLDKEELGVTDNFFKIGGHSLTATRMAARIQRDFNLDINLRKIYKYATIRELSVEIDEQLRLLHHHSVLGPDMEKLVI